MPALGRLFYLSAAVARITLASSPVRPGSNLT